MASGDIGGNQRRRSSGLERQLIKHTRQRQRNSRRRMRVRFVQIVSAGRDSRRQTQPRALALAGESAKSGEVEIVLRRDLLKASVEHRLEPGARQSVGVDRGTKRKRDRTAGRFFAPLADDDAAPPGKPHGREIGVARTHERVTDLGIETREGQESVARVFARIKRAEPLVAGMGARERRAMPVGVPERIGARRTARAHGAAMSAAATRRFSDCMTL